jgi:parallel beta-helix repeat protein
MHQNHQESRRFYSSKYRGVVALILLLFLVIVLFRPASSFSTVFGVNESNPILSNQVNHESITIASDNDFISQGWPGNGSISNPFLIEGLSILSDDECVKITNTSSYFVIRNCMLSWMLNQGHGTGVYLRNVTHGTIELSTMSGLSVAILDQHSANNVYRNNTIEDTWDGILVGSCNNNLVSNNTVAGNPRGVDIWLLDSRACSVLGNAVSGIFFDWSTNCTAEHNYGLVEGLNIDGNNLTHWLHQIHDNQFNGRMLGYFRDTADSTINGALYSQLILVNATRMMISDGVFHNLSMGVQIIYSSDCTMSDIVSENNVGAGVNIDNSYNCTLVDSIMNENWIGVSVSSSERIGVEGSQMTNNVYYGIRVDGSNSCHFIENTISNHSLDGISINTSNNCTLADNDVFGNEVGIVLSSSNNSLIFHNNVHENEIGIILDSATSHNSVYWNTFVWNTEKNAVDDGTFNIWDDGISRGNVWSDYVGYGPYTIPGLAQSVDRFPMGVGFQIPNEILLVLFIIITTLVLLYSQKERFLRFKSSKNQIEIKNTLRIVDN